MTPMSLAPAAESKPIREIAYETLKHAIITGDLPAGSRIVETDYAERMHISRTPLREALRKLERDGLVEYMLRRGVIVRAFTIADVEEIYTIRNCLEMITLPAIIQNATAQDIARLRAILAVGSQDVGDASVMIPELEGVEVVGHSSDHTIVDVTDTGRIWQSGDTLTFKVRYPNMLYSFTGSHVHKAYHYDK